MSQRETVPTARFLVWENDQWVKISLRPGQSLTRDVGGPTEEGYSWESTTWTHTGQGVAQEYSSGGRDCDGRHEYHSESYCPLEDLAARDATVENYDGTTSHAGVMAPDWQHGGSIRRDHTAEAAGY
ncbi:MAG TPA: hypothetical protein VM529_24860 [Gemmata sp.]|jgi:hypothetical protein|nr:hypothetical protein [Gemmata sp.]